MLLVASLVDDANCVAYFIDDFELGPVVGEILGREVDLLDTVLPVSEDFGGLGLGGVMMWVDREGVVLVVEGLLQFLEAAGGYSCEGFDEDGDSEVVLKCFAVGGHI